LQTIAERLANLFKGSQSGHLSFDNPQKESKPTGQKWKPTAYTRRTPPTLDLFRKHVDGTYPLGVIPITERGTCWFGAIDVDDYSLNQLDLVAKIESNKLPLIPTISKSNGLHLFLFAEEEVSASLMQNVLRHFAAKLGLGNAEIFPKQTEVLSERGDLGNGIYLPLLGTDFNGKLAEQTGLKKTGAKYGKEEYLSHCEKSKVTTSELLRYESETDRKKKPTLNKDDDKVIHLTDEPFSDGPPCLQHLAGQGISSGGRNSTLFMIGLYYIRVNETTWRERLEEANRLFFQPPLDSKEVSLIIQSIEKKGGRDPENGYKYTCRTQPMAGHCNSKLCRGRKYGVGTAEETPRVSGISKMTSDPVIWFISVGDHRIELTTDELQNYYRFQAKLMEKGTTFRTMKQSDWIVLVADAMQQGIELVEVPADAGISGHFKELLEEFLTDRQMAEDKEELLRNLPWKDDEKQRVYFKLSALQSFLEKQNFKAYTRGKLVSRIKDLGGDHHFFLLKNGRGLNTWFLPLSVLPNAPVYSIPELKKGPI
jgi:hypothetical protein